MPIIEIECGVLGQAGTLTTKRLAHIVTKLKTVAPFQDLQGHLYWSIGSYGLLGVGLGFRDSSK